MNNTSIRRNDFITLNADVKMAYSNKCVPAGTKCRVWKASRDGTLSVSPEGHYGSLHINKTLATKVAAPRAEVKVGDIFVCSWGYEQTNIDFYKITAVTGASVKYVSIGADRKYTGPMHGETTPNLNSVGTNESIARIRVDGTGKVSFRINSYSFAYPWGGEACFFSEWH